MAVDISSSPVTEGVRTDSVEFLGREGTQAVAPALVAPAGLGCPSGLKRDCCSKLVKCIYSRQGLAWACPNVIS